ncbi:MAG TPA: hypothetical protein VN829_22890 [Dongiaceae bacterium]|nr:hypothetical protein [Dongiaceae bacterium]
MNERAIMGLITKLRIAALLVAALLLFGGFQAAVHPKLRMVVPKPAQGDPSPNSAARPIELRTSTGSRVFGIIRMLVGGGLVLCVAWPMRPDLLRRR